MTADPLAAPGLSERALVDFLAGVVEQDAPGAPPAPLPEVVGALGLEPGSAVLLSAPNGVRMLTAFFAVLSAGCVPVPVAPSAGAGRITALAEGIGASAVLAPVLDPNRYGAGHVTRVGDLDLVRLPGAPRPHLSPGEVVLTTSGTSGIASGCVHGVDALLRNARRHAEAIGQRPDDTVLVNLPLHYSYGLVAQALAALVTGSRLVVSGPPFTPVQYREVVARQGVTVSSLTPSLVRGLTASGPPPDLRVLTVGGDACPPELTRELLSSAPGLELYLTYGLSEAGPRVATLAAHAEPAHRHASTGLPLRDVRTSLRPVGDGTAELLVHTDTALRRRLPAGLPSPLVAHRTVATGDLFTVDDDGYHYFRGRRSDSLVVNGEKVWLPSVREAASALPGVHRAVTRVRREDDGQGYELEVYVDEPSARRQAEIQRALHRVLLRAERPRRIILSPVTDTGWHK
ncbi:MULTISPECIES: class I adenylate-forming enzyme family protein [Actinosynnema]|uniref:class I adenylate-forming enzyme family protein n=1 Tax=Actinosynnema TaxID=40566 RepID=UPI0020A3A2E2|nr:class I adenylate-forming enzyme family protein [Actinosynnema pretiosum]MCP2099797.1 Acyl-CoA synthetase (AMP-forming)/AMP-acid ligase II [Actinosynnema pretiosum]